MDPIGCLLDDHARMRLAVADMSRLLEDAKREGRDARRSIVAERLPAAQRGLLGALQAHEALEESLLSKIAPADCEKLPWRAIRSQHAAVEEVFRIASAMIHLAHEGNLYGIDFALHRLSENLRDHFDYEEKNLFPLLRELLSSASSAEPAGPV